MKNQAVNAATRATLLIFYVLGLVHATFLSELPALRDHFQFTPTQMGNLLISAALGAMLAIPAAGPLVTRFGPTRIGTIGFTLWTVGLLGVLGALQASSVPLLVGCLLTANTGASLLNAAINTEGGYVEVKLRKPRMAWFHAAFSIGTVSGALLAVGSLRNGFSIYTHITAVICFSALLAVWSFTHFLPAATVAKLTGRGTVKETDQHREQTSGNSTSTNQVVKSSDAWKEKRTLLIGVLVFGIEITEGAAADWLALAMVDGFSLPVWYGTASLAIFLTALTATRLLSPHLQSFYSVDKLLRALLIFGLVGVVFLAFSPVYWLALFGAAFWGVGVALGYPLSASVLAADPLRSASRLSVMSTISFSAAIAGPALIGYLAEYVGYQRALGALVLPVFISVLLTGQLRPQNDHKLDNSAAE
ncbi:MFS transporter [Gleimia sp. 6138-11-ORH1]|uniref:MFS transporter n=1 Tax=Gleimia sp. 6138-11-ORH1 TaxID=2973937 RepID=UPI0021684F5D|nr:MFS transporter [Gleimia sp. 6138-11-ORH1]MCS4484644.1 MFS transporter [Gleimia sp. 6138-11-ORH1]